ncbi:hypothetical protein PG996_008295 [Apiospora saccharicola]|uniref:Uncharacterized protein n=1 Tax=Apiospora saccharicola TaxID=335842 RepID=A0ABR1UXI4_9PEZI
MRVPNLQKMLVVELGIRVRGLAYAGRTKDDRLAQGRHATDLSHEIRIIRPGTVEVADLNRAPRYAPGGYVEGTVGGGRGPLHRTPVGDVPNASRD